MKVKDLEPKQLKELLTYMDESGVFDYFDTPTELWNTPVSETALWSETPQGAEYWTNLVTTFNMK